MRTVARIYTQGRYRRASVRSGPGEPLVLRADAEREIDRLRTVLERIATYPMTRSDELGYEGCRELARTALDAPNAD